MARREDDLVDAAEKVGSNIARVWAHDRLGVALEPHVYEVRAGFADLLGDEATREHERREAHRLFAEMGATGHAQRVARELGLVSGRVG